eukprot:Seg3505.3 transcript_id=Seg3505.3/GoldUCD/mRNA.D3Y31 product="Beta-3 adrenergic receptor" protein_id=Seg3505.3/GoldUCD/D3Y31
MACSILPAVWPMSMAAIGVLVTTNILTAVTSILINVCFIAGILSKERLITPTNLFVVSLAVSDLLVGLISQPMMCAHLLVNRMTVRSCAIAYCSFYSLGIFCGASGLCLPVISLDRYIRMKKLQHYTRYVTKERVVIVIAILWINALVVAFLPLYGVPHRIFYSMLIVYLGTISIVMSIAYASVIIRSKASRVHAKPINTKQTTSSHRTSSATITTISMAATSTHVSVSESAQRLATDNSRQLRITVTVAMLVAVAILSWTPCFISGLIWALGIPSSNKSSTMVAIHYFSVTIGFASSSVNPLLYCWRIREVRKAALDILRNVLKPKIC